MVGYGFNSRRRLGLFSKPFPLIGLSVGLLNGMDPDDLQVKRLVNKGSYPSGHRGLTVNQLAKAFGGSNPSLPTSALIAQSVEHILGKNGVMGSNPIEGFENS